jgi:hypothetical protein
LSDVKLDDLFAFSFSSPGQQPAVLCSSNEKERLQWRLAVTYSIYFVHIAGSLKNQMRHKPLAQARLRDMQRIAHAPGQCRAERRHPTVILVHSSFHHKCDRNFPPESRAHCGIGLHWIFCGICGGQ